MNSFSAVIFQVFSAWCQQINKALLRVAELCVTVKATKQNKTKTVSLLLLNLAASLCLPSVGMIFLNMPLLWESLSRGPNNFIDIISTFEMEVRLPAEN